MWPTTLRSVDETHAAPADNLRLDEELLRAVDADPVAGVLRVWEQPMIAVIVGRSNALEREVDIAACQQAGIPVLKRCSGGGAVVLGPGCLCYSLILPLTEQHRQWGVSVVTANIMQRLAVALSRPEAQVEVRGVSDLVLEGRKFSGNSQRWLKHSLLHHGTVLYDFDLDLIGRYLRFPSRVPDYRAERGHREFVRNLDFPRDEIVSRLRNAWNAQEVQG